VKARERTERDYERLAREFASMSAEDAAHALRVASALTGGTEPDVRRERRARAMLACAWAVLALAVAALIGMTAYLLVQWPLGVLLFASAVGVVVSASWALAFLEGRRTHMLPTRRLDLQDVAVRRVCADLPPGRRCRTWRTPSGAVEVRLDGRLVCHVLENGEVV
jgi:hypothetical protein